MAVKTLGQVKRETKKPVAPPSTTGPIKTLPFEVEVFKKVEAGDDNLRIERTPTGIAIFLSEDLTIKINRLDPYEVTGIQANEYDAEFGELVRVDPTAGAFPVNLPSAADNAGRGITVWNVSDSSEDVTVTPDGSETINGAATYVLAAARGQATFVSDGENWLASPPV